MLFNSTLLKFLFWNKLLNLIILKTKYAPVSLIRTCYNDDDSVVNFISVDSSVLPLFLSLFPKDNRIVNLLNCYVIDLAVLHVLIILSYWYNVSRVSCMFIVIWRHNSLSLEDWWLSRVIPFSTTDLFIHFYYLFTNFCCVTKLITNTIYYMISSLILF